MTGRLLCVLLLAGVTINAKDCKVPEPPRPSPSPSASATLPPSPKPSTTPSPVNPCDSVLCPPGTRCMLDESQPPKAVCIPLPNPSPSATPTPVPSVVPSVFPSPVASWPWPPPPYAVPVIYDGKCPSGWDKTYHDDNKHGGFRQEGTGLHICTIPSFCGTSVADGRNTCPTPNAGDPLATCDMIAWRYWYGAGGQWGIRAELGPDGPGYFRDSGGHYLDAYGREFVNLSQPPVHDWTYYGSCAPAPPPNPVPSPTPRPKTCEGVSCPPGTVCEVRRWDRPDQGPVCVPFPKPSPSVSVPPTPPPVTGCGTCPEPIGIKLGFASNPRKLEPGYRNLAGITPIVKGDCCHKGDPSPNAVCAVNEGCGDHVGSLYEVLYGQPQAWQTGTGFVHDPVDRATDGCVVTIDGIDHVPCGYNLTFATNSLEEWTNGTAPECEKHGQNCGSYRQAGPMEVCVSLPPLRYWHCQRGEMGADGLMRGFGKDEKSYDVPKDGSR